MVPKPPQPDMPIDPKVEWTMMLQGETVHVNPQDNDQLHLIRHMADIQKATADPQTDPDALKELKLHYLAQIQQLEHKQVMQAILERGAQLGSQLAQTNPALAQLLPQIMQQASAAPPQSQVPPVGPGLPPGGAPPTPGGVQ
jgi:ornithine carbamoyltransferase